MPDETSQLLPNSEDSKLNTATAGTNAQDEDLGLASSDVSCHQMDLVLDLSSDAALAGALENSCNPDIIAILGSAQISF